MSCIEILIIFSIIGYFLYKWSTKTFDTFNQRGLPHEKPLPLIGNSLAFLKNKESLHKIMLNKYRKNKQNKMYGSYNFRNPFFIVNDPYLIKKMGVKDFDSFTNHQRIFNAEEHQIFRSMLTVVRDKRWKDMRNTLSPIFTSAKMRAMFTLMNDCFAESMTYLHQHLQQSESSFDIELKDCFARLSNDLIATTAFGLKVDSFENPSNEFYTIGKAVANTRGWQAFKFMLCSMSPGLFRLFRLEVFDHKITKYFGDLVVEAMEYREKNNIVRPDMIHLLMEAKRESSQEWSNEDIVAQCFIFFFAAFENNANLLCTTCYELMDNPDVQKKLYDEIMVTQNKLNGKTLDYETLHDMKYLDMVVCESLRKWPLGALTDRECGKDYTVTDENDKFVCELKKGDRVWFQIIGIQRDEQYYENPELFYPERFNEQNKHKINPSIYLPFGVGPRICIGSRYALMQAKAMLYFLLKDFKVERCAKTCENLMDDIRGFQIAPKSGFWFKLTKR